MSDLIKIIAFPFMVVGTVFVMMSILPMMLIAEQLDSTQITIFLGLHIAYFSIAFAIRIWVGILAFLAYPIIIFQIYSNFFLTL